MATIGVIIAYFNAGNHFNAKNSDLKGENIENRDVGQSRHIAMVSNAEFSPKSHPIS